MADQNEKKEEALLRDKIRDQIIGYLTAALGLVAGLAWNDAIKSLIDQIYPAGEGNNVLAKFWYAVVITFAVVSVSYYLIRYIGSSRKNNK